MMKLNGSEIIERYEGVAQARNIARPTAVKSRISTMGDGSFKINSVKRRKSVAKGIGFEFMMTQMSDQGVQRMFDACSDDFFVALGEELGL